MLAIDLLVTGTPLQDVQCLIFNGMMLCLIKSGRIPKPTKIERVSVWRLSEVRAGIDAVRDHA